MTSFALGPALLFCPADRPDRYRKALDRADAVILDLEDAVTAERRPAAREAMVANPLDPERVIVRVNAYETADFADDLAALQQTPYRYVMLAKASPAADYARLRPYSVVALCETAEAITQIDRIAAAPPVTALMLGAEDLVASMGGTSSRGPTGYFRSVVSHARATLALAAAVHSVAMVDSIHPDITDHTGLAMEAAEAAALGFVATGCIHPRQVAVVREAYRPSDEDLAWAREVRDAAAGAISGVVQVRGRMVDEPVVRHADQLLRRAAYMRRLQT